MLAFATAFVVFIATFLAAAITAAVAWMILQRRAEEQGEGGPSDFSPDAPVLLKEEALSTVGLLARLLSHFDFSALMKRRIAEAGLNWTVGRIASLALLIGSVAVAALLSLDWLPGGLALLCGAGAACLPYFYVMRRRNKRLLAFEDQFPDVLDGMARSMRAGYPLAASVDMAASESQQPVAGELRKVFDEVALGMSWDQALHNLVDRVPLVDVSFFAAAVQMQTRTGGRLNEVLARLAETMRERTALKGEVRSITAHGKLSGLVLTVLPIIVVSILSIASPTYMNVLLQNPFGRYILMGGAVSLVLAHLVIRKLVNIEI